MCRCTEAEAVVPLLQPTSSLDRYAALSVMTALKRLASAGHTIVASIHQPPAMVTALLDQIILLSHGQTLFVGPVNEVSADLQPDTNIAL